jgi:hypothetical protein
MTVWKRDFTEFRDKQEKFDADKAKLFGVIIGQMSDSSKDQVATTQDGMDALRDKDPLDLVKVIVTTHLTGGKTNDDENLYSAQYAYTQLVMSREEKIATYYRRFETALTTLVECAARAHKNNVVPDNVMQNIHFVKTLNGFYSEYQISFDRDIITQKPTTVQEAYEQIVQFGSNKLGYSDQREQNHRNAFVTKKGGRGRSARGGKGSGGRGNCHNCNQPGHWKDQCPNTKSAGVSGEQEEDVTKAIKEVREDKKKKN